MLSLAPLDNNNILRNVSHWGMGLESIGKGTIFLKINHELRRLHELFIGTIPIKQFNESTLQQKK